MTRMAGFVDAAHYKNPSCAKMISFLAKRPDHIDEKCCNELGNHEAISDYQRSGDQEFAGAVKIREWRATPWPAS